MRLLNFISSYRPALKSMPEESRHSISKFLIDWRVKDFLNLYLQDARIEAFGSFATKLYLPNSDMDIVFELIIERCASMSQCIKRPSTRRYLKSYTRTEICLSRSNWSPMLRCLSSSSWKLRVNWVSIFPSINWMVSRSFHWKGLKQIPEVQKSFEIYPEARYLIYIIKCMLR